MDELIPMKDFGKDIEAVEDVEEKEKTKPRVRSYFSVDLGDDETDMTEIDEVYT